MMTLQIPETGFADSWDTLSQQLPNFWATSATHAKAAIPKISLRSQHDVAL